MVQYFDSNFKRNTPYRKISYGYLTITSDMAWLVTSSWWRHQMETFSALLTICAGNSPVPGEFPTQKPVTQSFDIFFDLHLNKLLSKQSWGWWFETPPWSLWRQCNVYTKLREDYVKTIAENDVCIECN